MLFDPDLDEDDPDEAGVDERDFSHFLTTDDVRAGFAMVALKHGYELIERGEDRGAVAQAIDLLFHEAQFPEGFDVFGWASDYFERIPWDDFMNAYVSSPAEGLYSEEESEAIAGELDAALEQVGLENA
ncbi:MAG: hypothetical protein MR009_00405 [Sutterellaceae bacterium]|nr:hypothetical protein [Sutterellaceae bacterium]MDD7442493.1 hypothetical protein [Sutterellaceae bacterium]MDY2867591.1 hypothetical protein [Mesosutterella sp.]